MLRPPHRRLAAVAVVVLLAMLMPSTAGASTGYERVTGAGSTWSANALQQWIAQVRSRGITIDYTDSGSSNGRVQFRNQTVDFAVSEIPYGIPDRGVPDPLPQRGFAYMPVVAGGTAFMYNLKISGRQVTNLRLSGDVIAKIFTGAITTWNDPAIAADNPGLTLPATRVVPVVRSDGSGTSAQFTQWMVSQHPGVWNTFCGQVGLPQPCGQTSNYPAPSGFVAQNGSNGVAGYVRQAQAEGAITYVEYSFALNARFPVAKVLNGAGYYVEPTAQNVAVGLLKAQIETQNTDPAVYLTQKLAGVYTNPDPRAYPLSSYSYMILPTEVAGTFNAAKGKALGDFGYYFLCEGQQRADDLGYSPLPINLVQAGFDQLRRVPGVDAQTVNIASCNNPTFSADGTNTLANTAPQPSECDRRGVSQCSAGTGGVKEVETPVSAGGGGAAPGAAPAAPAAGAAGGPAPADAAGAPAAPGATDPALAAGGVVDPALAGLDPGAVPPSGAATTEALIDPDTGEVLGAGVGAGPAAVTGVSVELASNSSWQLQHTLMLAAVAALVVASMGPGLLVRRLRGANR